MRSTSRFGFAGVANALHLKLSLLSLLEVALLLASWRAFAVEETPLLHCAWLVVRLGVLWHIAVGGDPRTPFSPLRSATPLRLALLRA